MTSPTTKGRFGGEAHLESAVGAGCGCFCDDIAVRFVGGKAAEARSACALGEEWLLSLEPIDAAAWVEGKRVDIEEALLKGGKLLEGRRQSWRVGAWSGDRLSLGRGEILVPVRQ
jgi:formylmethanofuran dehydrogenase subunit B